jgi:hypothetical protein
MGWVLTCCADDLGFCAVKVSVLLDEPSVLQHADVLRYRSERDRNRFGEFLHHKGMRPGGSARPGQADARFTDLRVAYLVHRYGLRSRYDRLRDQGMLTKTELAARLGICESTLTRWVEHGLVTRHACSGQAYLYEAPGPNPPVKHSSRWNRLADRAAAIHRTKESKSSYPRQGDAV